MLSKIFNSALNKRRIGIHPPQCEGCGCAIVNGGSVTVGALLFHAECAPREIERTRRKGDGENNTTGIR